MQSIMDRQFALRFSSYSLVISLVTSILYFLVINKGAKRMAEVNAKFILDTMPLKGMAIDADLNSGVIDILEAERRRAQLQAEAGLSHLKCHEIKNRSKYLMLISVTSVVVSGIVYLMNIKKQRQKIL